MKSVKSNYINNQNNQITSETNSQSEEALQAIDTLADAVLKASPMEALLGYKKINIYRGKIMKTFSLISNGTVHDIKLGVSFYEMGGNLGIRMIELNGKMQEEPWSTLTINLPEEPRCEKDCSYIDVYKNGSEILEWIAKNKLAMPTGRTSTFGFPEYRFNPYILAEADPKGYAVYLLSLGYGIAQKGR